VNLKQEQHRKEMEQRLGIKFGSGGPVRIDPDAPETVTPAVPAAEAPAPTVVETPAAPVAETPQPPVVETPAPPAKTYTEDDLKRADERIAGAKAEQQKLSALQVQLMKQVQDLNALKETLEAKAKALDGIQPVVPAVPHTPHAPVNEKLQALMDASPDLAEAIQELNRSTVQAELQPLQDVQARLATFEQAAAKNASDLRFERVVSDVQKVFPDAVEVAASSEFQTWLEGQPARIRDGWVDAIYTNTANADPAEITMAISLYKNATQPPPVPGRPVPMVAPTLSPASVSKTAVSAGLGPLTDAEIANFGALKAAVEHDPRALRSLMERVRLTQTTRT